MEKTKKVRSTKFMPEETSLLIRLALNEKHIVENKTTDAEMWKLKANTWAHIAELFNASSGVYVILRLIPIYLEYQYIYNKIVRMF